MSALHRDDASGFAGLQAALSAAGRRETPAAILDDWLAAVALDGVLERGAELVGRGAAGLLVPGLDARVNWDTPHAYDTPGAPPNGADFVRLRDAGGGYLRARDLRTLSFDGAESLGPLPVEWNDPEPADRPGNPALASGSGPNFDRSIGREVTVPAADPTLTFSTRWQTEVGWDFAVVQVSTDGGETYTSLANADTTSEADPGAEPRIVAQLPGFTGDSGAGGPSRSTSRRTPGRPCCSPSAISPTPRWTSPAGGSTTSRSGEHSSPTARHWTGGAP
jgi:hypothetical protein